MSECNPDTANSKPRQPGPPRKKTPRRITADYLHNSGLYYLERFSSSAANFEKVMMRKVTLSCRHHTDQDPAACKALVKETVAKFLRSGLLNDRLYAEGLVNALRRRGMGEKAIIQKLRAKGIDTGLSAALLSDHDDRQGRQRHESEMEAALALCRRKKIGPFALPDKLVDDNERRKNLARLARAGFSYETALKALEMRVEE